MSDKTTFIIGKPYRMIDSINVHILVAQTSKERVWQSATKHFWIEKLDTDTKGYQWIMYTLPTVYVKYIIWYKNFHDDYVWIRITDTEAEATKFAKVCTGAEVLDIMRIQYPKKAATEVGISCPSG